MKNFLEAYFRKKMSTIYVGIFWLCVLVLLCRLFSSMSTLRDIKKRCDDVSCEIDDQEKKNAILTQKILDMENNIDLAETCIRSGLKYVKKNEIVVSI